MIDQLETGGRALDAAGVPLSWALLATVVAVLIGAALGGWGARALFSRYVSNRIDEVVQPLVVSIAGLKTEFLDALKQSERHRDSKLAEMREAQRLAEQHANAKIAEIHARIDGVVKEHHDHVLRATETFMSKLDAASALSRIEQAVIRVEKRINRESGG